MGSYLDLYLLPVPRAQLDHYRRQAEVFGKLLLELGARSYREYAGDDLASPGAMSFGDTVKLGDDEVLTSAVAEFDSRAQRDEVMAKLDTDPRAKDLMNADPIGDMKRMHYGGFTLLVTA